MSRPEALQRYYAIHARIYDVTRWSFLFGRGRLIDAIAQRAVPGRILEIGCGTGSNLLALGRRFPAAKLVGVDGSCRMLEVARRKLRHFGDRVELIEGFYPTALGPMEAPDLICLSYCLSMIDPGFERVVSSIAQALAPGGHVAVVDFHGTDEAWFRRWMAKNHVRMESHLIPVLRTRFPDHQVQVRTAYGGLWQYFLFVARTGPVRRARGPVDWGASNGGRVEVPGLQGQSQ